MQKKKFFKKEIKVITLKCDYAVLFKKNGVWCIFEAFILKIWGCKHEWECLEFVSNPQMSEQKTTLTSLSVEAIWQVQTKFHPRMKMWLKTQNIKQL